MSPGPPDRRTYLRAVGSFSLVGLAGCLGSAPPDQTSGDASGSTDGPAWLTTPLTDVRNSESFTLAGLSDRPVLLETFAVWCSTCLQQQRQIAALRSEIGDQVVPVSLNVDPNEDAEQVREHVDRHGFDWRYAIAPPSVTESLIETFDRSITVPPRAPMALVCHNEGTRRLADGVKSAETLRSEAEAGC